MYTVHMIKKDTAMEKRKHNQKFNKNNAIIGFLLLALLLVTGILPALLKLVIGLIVGIVGLVIGLVVGFIGLVIGLFGAVIGIVFGIVFGLLPIVVMAGIVVFAVKAINGDAKFDREAKTKRKNDSYV